MRPAPSLPTGSWPATAAFPEAITLEERRESRWWMRFLLAHLPLALILKANPLAATAYALAIVGLGFYWVLRDRSPERVVMVMGYIASSEGLWRASKAMIFHESAKYAIAGLALVSIARYGTYARGRWAPLLYFALLVPSIAVMPYLDRNMISFNLSGPFCLAMASFFLSTCRLDAETLRRVLLSILGPILGLAFAASFSTITTPTRIDFMTTKIATAGLGNNQASSLLALGGLVAFLFLVIGHKDRLLRWMVAGAGLWCLGQGALSFSRGGIVTALAAIGTAGFFLLGDRRSRGSTMMRSVILVLVATFVLYPMLNAFTGGGLERRFTDPSLTGRDRIIEADLIAFRENPVLGVGPGESKAYHEITFRRSSSHTEYSRMLAEHGSLGLLAMVVLASLCIRHFFAAQSLMAKAFSASLTVWTLLFMMHAAMRMAAPSFTFALGGAVLVLHQRSWSFPWSTQPSHPRPLGVGLFDDPPGTWAKAPPPA